MQAITVAWMSVEALASLWAAWRAKSPALLALGGDSAIELASAVAVLWRFSAVTSEYAERKAARITGALLFALAASVAATSLTAFLGDSEARPTLMGDRRLDSCGGLHAITGKEETATLSTDE